MMDMQLICERFHPDVALLPIGGRFTMDIDTAVMSCKFLKPKVVIPMHYNATALTQADPTEFVDKMKKAWPEIKVVILKPGETYLAKES
jgi:L-ascorbate metabolism protein UlaG (beta-lactamase superfamily)